MSDVLSVALPFVSVFVGAGITYVFNVRTRRRTKVEEIYHEAIAAVAVAHAAHDFIAELKPWRSAEPEEMRAFNSDLARQGNLHYVQAIAEARAALARASAYDPRLNTFLEAPDSVGREVVYARAEEIMRHLRQNIEAGR